MINKNKAKVLLIIVLIVFTIIPFFASMLRLEEGFTINLKASGENDGGIKLGLESDGAAGENTQIDRIKTSEGKYEYCIGDVSCGSGNLVQEGTDPYTLSDGVTNVGYTYGETCDDNTTSVSCSGTSAFSKFYGPFEDLPAVFQVSGNNLLISDEMPTIYDNNVDEEDSAKTDVSDTSLKCLANNGAVVGDPLCCGQEGVVQNTKYNCPSEYPHCIGYKCGETWGKCSKTSDKPEYQTE